MELYQLAYFIAVAHQRNFTHAARHLHLAQPALSRQIRNLEEELGAPLFIRGRRQTRLTAAGEAFLPRAEALIAMAGTAKQAVADVAGLRRGRLVIAAIQTLSAYWLPPVVQRFRQSHPSIELVLAEDSSARVAELVDTGGAELGFLQLPVNGEKFDIRELFTEPFLVILPPRHALAGHHSLALRELAGEPFISYKGKARDVALAACRAAGFEPRVVCESSELETVRALVAAGLGVAVLPRIALPAARKNLMALPLRAPRLERTVGLITRRGHVWSAVATSGQPRPGRLQPRLRNSHGLTPIRVPSDRPHPGRGSGRFHEAASCEPRIPTRRGRRQSSPGSCGTA